MDNTDLLHIDLTKDESIDKVHNAIQHSVNSWGNLLIATGGVLQQSKCFYSIISFEWTNGIRKYANNSLKGKFGISVPLPGGNEAMIDHKSVEHVEKTLGAMTSPDGNSGASLQLIQDKAQQWINAVQNGHLHRCNIWFALKVQFWPRINYGLYSLTATFDELEGALYLQYYQIPPLCGVVQTTTVESRTIDAGFFGIGLPHLGVESLIAMANLLLMYYGCQTATGRFMQASYSFLFVELGLLFQSLQEQYNKYGFLVTHLWMKMLWEKLSMFDMQVVVADQPLKFPREGDQFIMQVLIKAGYTGKILSHLNRVRVSLQVLFMSDILTASGNKVSTDILAHRPQGEAWSKMRWPHEYPTDSNMKIWRDAMLSICPSRSTTSSIGRIIGRLHRIWRWFWNEADLSLHHRNLDGETEDMFASGQKPNRFTYSHSQPRREHEIVCSVQPTLEGEHWRLLSTATCTIQDTTPSTFVEVLHSWGNTWLWEHMSVYGGVIWLEQSISDGTLVAVTEGSYIGELYPTLCSAAFVIECTKEHGRVVVSFLGALLVANAYRGELLGLMAIHLILLSINKIH